MINKDNVITLAWMMLGEQSQTYNGNITDRQKIAEYLFDAVIRSVASDENFLFNSRKIALSKNLNPTNEDGEIRYNIPVDFLNKIWLSDPKARFENEFIYSEEDDLKMAYCYKLQLSEFPDYLENYLVLSLAYRLAMAYETFASRVGTIASSLDYEVARISKMEGLPFGIDRGE